MQDVRATCHKLLGLTSDDNALGGTDLPIRWLHENFDVGLPPDASEDLVRNFARTYVLMVFSIVLFVDKSRNQVQLFLLPLLREFEEVGSFS